MAITWNHFIFFAMTAVVLWTMGAIFSWRRQRATMAKGLTATGNIVFLLFIIGLWLSLERPPLRTMGETRLWYSFFLPLTALIIYSRFHIRWILSFGTMLATVFVCINLCHPEIHNKTLMPALQSPWFAPHVIVYMLAYALFAIATGMGCCLLSKRLSENNSPLLYTCDNLVETGLSLMTIGMLFGALWAKEAWGHYWTWDPKETWAATTWLTYLLYTHYRHHAPQKIRPATIILLLGFAFLQICWWGINYLPASQGASMHTYNME